MPPQNVPTLCTTPGSIYCKHVKIEANGGLATMIDEGIKRVRLEPDTDLLHVLEDVNADRAPRLIERDGKALALVVSPDSYQSANIEPKSRRFKENLLALGGIWEDLDADRMIADIYASRRSMPPSPPIEL